MFNSHESVEEEPAFHTIVNPLALTTTTQQGASPTAPPARANRSSVSETNERSIILPSHVSQSNEWVCKTLLYARSERSDSHDGACVFLGRRGTRLEVAKEIRSVPAHIVKAKTAAMQRTIARLNAMMTGAGNTGAEKSRTPGAAGSVNGGRSSSNNLLSASSMQHSVTRPTVAATMGFFLRTTSNMLPPASQPLAESISHGDDLSRQRSITNTFEGTPSIAAQKPSQFIHYTSVLDLSTPASVGADGNSSIMLTMDYLPCATLERVMSLDWMQSAVVADDGLRPIDDHSNAFAPQPYALAQRDASATVLFGASTNTFVPGQAPPQRRRIVPRTAKRILKSILEDMVKLHSHRIAHRHLRPSSVLVTCNLHTYLDNIGDLCTRTPVDEDQLWIWYAPEVSVGDVVNVQCSSTSSSGSDQHSVPHADGAMRLATSIVHGETELLSEAQWMSCDVFSYGLLVYWLATGNRPFESILGDAKRGTEAVELAMIKVRGKRARWNSFLAEGLEGLSDKNVLSPHLMNLARACLVEDPDERPTFSELAQRQDDFFVDLDDEPVQPPSPARTVSRAGSPALLAPQGATSRSSSSGAGTAPSFQTRSPLRTLGATPPPVARARHMSVSDHAPHIQSVTLRLGGQCDSNELVDSIFDYLFGAWPGALHFGSNQQPHSPTFALQPVELRCSKQVTKGMADHAIVALLERHTTVIEANMFYHAMITAPSRGASRLLDKTVVIPSSASTHHRQGRMLGATGALATSGSSSVQDDASSSILQLIRTFLLPCDDESSPNFHDRQRMREEHQCLMYATRVAVALLLIIPVIVAPVVALRAW